MQSSNKVHLGRFSASWSFDTWEVDFITTLDHDLVRIKWLKMTEQYIDLCGVVERFVGNSDTIPT